VDDIGDGTLPAAEKLAALDEARSAVLNPDQHPDDPVLVALADAAQRMALPLKGVHRTGGRLRDGRRGTHYQTFADLDLYCRCVAGSIGRLSLGVSHPSPAPRRSAGRPARRRLQVTNILRDIREDFLTGRIYLRRTTWTSSA